MAKSLTIKDKDFLKHIEKVTKSKTLCLAKWLNSTIWLGSGMTTSCHHPPAHKIPLKELNKNPKLIHNTEEKKEDRRKMQCGERPSGCDYCWKIEDMGEENVSDRVYKSKIYDEADLQFAKDLPYYKDVNLKTLEISFSRACNFACSYCNPAFSTTWVKDIKDNGPYENLETDGRNHFIHTHKSAQLYKMNETNPYTEAFWKWWESDLKESLDEIRITGGEPLMLPEVWKLMNDYKNAYASWNPDRCLDNDTPSIKNHLYPRLAINTNLSLTDNDLNKLVHLSLYIPDFQLYTSCEATGTQAEYIRDGLNYSEFIHKFKRLVTSPFSSIQLHCMSTINALCLPTLTNFLNEMVEIRKTYCTKHFKENMPSFTLNILRFPSFQSPLILPKELRLQYAGELKIWLMKITLDTNSVKYIHDHEIDHINRLIEYLENVDKPHDEGFDLEKCRKDFKNFYTQYDKRRGKSFKDTFSKELVAWYESI